MTDKRDSFLSALSSKPRTWSDTYKRGRAEQEVARTISDTQWLRERGIVPGKEPGSWEPMGMWEHFKQMLGGTPTGQQKSGEFIGQLPAAYTQEAMRAMPLGDVPIRDKHGRIVEWRPRSEFEQPRDVYDPVQAGSADPTLLLADLLDPSPGGEATKGARVFFGDPAMRQRVLYFLDWARKNLRGEARKGLLQSLREGWLLTPFVEGSGLGQYMLARGKGELPTAIDAELAQLSQQALEEGPEQAKAFVKEARRLEDWGRRKKNAIVEEYKELAQKKRRGSAQTYDIPTARLDTPAPPMSIIAVDSSHPLSTVFHEGVHAADWGMSPGEFKRAKQVIKETPWKDMMELWYTNQYSSEPTEQLATFLQKLGSGEARLMSQHALSRTAMDPALAQRLAQGWDLPGVSGAFPMTPGGSRLERRVMQPALERWGRWKQASKGTGRFAGEPEFLQQLEWEANPNRQYLLDYIQGLNDEASMARKMSRR